jgi:hypothetical protein
VTFGQQSWDRGLASGVVADAASCLSEGRRVFGVRIFVRSGWSRVSGVVWCCAVFRIFRHARFSRSPCAFLKSGEEEGKPRSQKCGFIHPPKNSSSYPQGQRVSSWLQNGTHAVGGECARGLVLQSFPPSLHSFLPCIPSFLAFLPSFFYFLLPSSLDLP